MPQHQNHHDDCHSHHKYQTGTQTQCHEQLLAGWEWVPPQNSEETGTGANRTTAEQRDDRDTRRWDDGR